MRISDWSSDVCSSDLSAMWLIVSVPADSRFPRSIKSPRRSIRPKMSESQSPKAGAPDAAYHRGRAAIAGGAIAQGLDDLRRAADGGHRDAQVEAARVLIDRKSTRLNSSH